MANDRRHGRKRRESIERARGRVSCRCGHHLAFSLYFSPEKKKQLSKECRSARGRARERRWGSEPVEEVRAGLSIEQHPPSTPTNIRKGARTKRARKTDTHLLNSALDPPTAAHPGRLPALPEAEPDGKPMQPGVRRVVNPYPKPHPAARDLAGIGGGGGGISSPARSCGAQRLPSFPPRHAAPAPAGAAAVMNDVRGGHHNGVAPAVQLRLRRLFFPGVRLKGRGRRRRRRPFSRAAGETTTATATADLLPAAASSAPVVVREIDTDAAAQERPKAAVEVRERVRPVLEGTRADAGESAVCVSSAGGAAWFRTRWGEKGVRGGGRQPASPK